MRPPGVQHIVSDSPDCAYREWGIPGKGSPSGTRGGKEQAALHRRAGSGGSGSGRLESGSGVGHRRRPSLCPGGPGSVPLRGCRTGLRGQQLLPLSQRHRGGGRYPTGPAKRRACPMGRGRSFGLAAAHDLYLCWDAAHPSSARIAIDLDWVFPGTTSVWYIALPTKVFEAMGEWNIDLDTGGHGG
jgi:hypothetical protein